MVPRRATDTQPSLRPSFPASFPNPEKFRKNDARGEFPPRVEFNNYKASYLRM